MLLIYIKIAFVLFFFIMVHLSYYKRRIYRLIFYGIFLILFALSLFVSFLDEHIKNSIKTDKSFISVISNQQILIEIMYKNLRMSPEGHKK